MEPDAIRAEQLFGAYGLDPKERPEVIKELFVKIVADVSELFPPVEVIIQARDALDAEGNLTMTELTDCHAYLDKRL